MLPPKEIGRVLLGKIGARILSARPCGGGMINSTAVITTDKGEFFVKWNSDLPVGHFTLEAKGLETIASCHAIRTPEVIHIHESRDYCSFLVLEYLNTSFEGMERRFAIHFAEALARLHRESHGKQASFGLDYDNYLGAQPQINMPCEDWETFYRERRLLPQIRRATSLKRLPAYREKLLMQVIEKMAKFLEGLECRPCLIHGDLWSGNFIRMEEDVALIDPAIYYSEREMELAYVQLFGGFPANFLGYYHSAYPLQKGYEERRPLHQLYPLLIHLNHFGESYGGLVDQVCGTLLRRL